MNKPYDVVHDDVAAKIVRETAAQEVVKFALRLANMSVGLELKIQEKLAPVMLSDRSVTSGELEKQEIEYPPLFKELQTHLQVIENSLCIMENTILRIDL